MIQDHMDDYWASGGVKKLTAVVSVATAVAQPPLIPRAFQVIRDAQESDFRQQLEAANEELELLSSQLQRMNEQRARFFASVMRASLAATEQENDLLIEGADSGPGIAPREPQARVRALPSAVRLGREWNGREPDWDWRSSRISCTFLGAASE